MNQKRLITLLLLMSSTIMGFAQSNNINTSTKAIKELKHGVLVVIIPSYHKKIKALEKIESDPKTKASIKKRNRRLIESAKEDRKKIADQIQKGFIENYDFSEVAFIHDTATIHILKKGVKKGVFLRADKNIDLKDKAIFFLRYGYTDRATTTGIGAWMVTDDQLQDLQKPFPYYVTVYQPLREILRAFFSTPQNILYSKIGSNKKEIGLVLNDNFWRYYNYH